MYAYVWELIWEKIDDLGLGHVDCTWINGHSTWNGVLEGVIRQWLLDGNRAADEGAKKGVSIREFVKRFKTRCQVVTTAAKDIARVNAHVVDRMPDATPNRRRKDNGRRAPKPRAAIDRAVHRHDPTHVGNRVFC